MSGREWTYLHRTGWAKHIQALHGSVSLPGLVKPSRQPADCHRFSLTEAKGEVRFYSA